ncbi:MAG: class I SAM-dependent rRNA methyltransferase [Oscillospiraceae bacterium]|nr:class I SAM-dependent rRNA methyltransferase [Oscillospiraceae bacterium]
MKTERDYPQVHVTAKGTRWLESNNPWVYESDVFETTGELNNGDIVDVISPKGKYLGSGFYSENSKIRVRILSRNANDTFDRAFFKRRIEYAVRYRQAVMDDISCCRIVFGESDELPGLTVDKYNEILVMQVVSYGMDRIKGMLTELLIEVFRENGIEIQAVYERDDLSVRKLEGLEEQSGYLYCAEGFDESKHETVINENGIQYFVDYVSGQKTGFFLDQKFNRKLVGEIAHGKKVLDCFTHTGSFALNAAAGGAEKVVAMDISESAIETARRNAALNGLEDRVEFEVGDTFDYLDKVSKREYDLIILDPPAFTKSRETVRNAYRGYKNINARAMRLLGRGGYLVTCSCSHFMTRELFEKMLGEAAEEAGVTLKQISFTQQAKDHPILMNVSETDYLKFYILQVI